MNNIDLNKIKKIHFIGIGGIGISALAKMMVHQGKGVSGTNDNPSPQTLDELRAQGVPVYLDRDISHIPQDVDLIVYSLAWDQNEQEFMAKVRGLGMPVLTYFEALGLACQGKFVVAVAGTHGKTTTTAMIAKILADAGREPNMIVGSLVDTGKGKTNFMSGNSDLLVVEACEYKRSFINIHPTIAVITNIEEDHLDYYKDLDDIKNAFKEFVSMVPASGFIICDSNNEVVKEVVSGAVGQIVDYTNESVPKLSVIGKHNETNAKTAKAVARVLTVDSGMADKSLQEFKGAWRRLEFKGQDENGALKYDDYAHHPTEIKSGLNALRSEFPDKKIVVTFQPHLFSRTKSLLNDFAGSFSDADTVLITDIYAAREKDDGSIHAKDLVAEIAKNGVKVEYSGDIKATAERLKELSADDTVLVTMGAGDIYEAFG